MSYEGLVPTQALLARKRDELVARQADRLRQVDDMLRAQQAVSEALRDELGSLREKGEVLDELEARASEGGLLAALTRTLTRRRTMLERQSVTEGLIAQYETVNGRLRKATAFSDELRLCALDLQHQVDQLHQDLARSLRNEQRCAERIRDLEEKLAGLDETLGLSPEASERLRDKLTFEERTEVVNLELFMAEARLARQHLEPARKLRDTMLSLHEDMARFVVAATSTVNAAGRRIQALGMAADAPVVVQELQQSLDELQSAMDATEAYVAQSQTLLTDVLPELARRLEQQQEVHDELGGDALDEYSRERARSLASQALQDAAEEEVDAALRKTL